MTAEVKPRKGIYLALPEEVIEYIRQQDPTGQQKATNGILYIIRLFKEEHKEAERPEPQEEESKI